MLHRNPLYLSVAENVMYDRLAVRREQGFSIQCDPIPNVTQSDFWKHRVRFD